MSDDFRPLREAFSAMSEDAGARENCPSPEALFSAVRLELEPRERRAIVDHISSCASCAEDWRLACELDPVRETVADRAPEAPFFETLLALWRSPALAGAAAALAVLLAVSVYVIQKPTEPGYRDPGGDGIRSLVPEDVPQPREECRLRWTPGPEGARYDVRVTTESLSPVVSLEGLTENELEIPEAELVDLPPGATLLWQVETRLPDGTRWSSDTFIVRVR